MPSTKFPPVPNADAAASLALAEHLRSLLAKGPPLTANQLQTATGRGQASVSMALGKLGSAVCKIGAARSTRYALTQPILGLPAQQSVTLAAPNADHGKFGELTFLQGNAVYVRGPRKSQWLAQAALPWWLTPLRPQGFLGRQYARLRPDFAADPDDWTLAQVLYIAANHAADPPGAFSIASMESSTLASQHAPTEPLARAAYFDQLASVAAQGLPAGSSAGGEQPKFLCVVDGEHVIVKFTPPRGTPFGERWHDLLAFEQLALQVLGEQGLPVARSELVCSARRSYLLSRRFDRSALTGKRHVVAATAIHAEFVPTPRRHWIATCEALVAQKLLAPAALQQVAHSYLFGEFIGNTDMHFGNLSFFVDDVTLPKAKLRLEPTPVYDMLPMMWRPGVHSGNLEPDPLRQPALPAGYAHAAALAKAWALDYWQRAEALPGLNDALRPLCRENARRLRHGFD